MSRPGASLGLHGPWVMRLATRILDSWAGTSQVFITPTKETCESRPRALALSARSLSDPRSAARGVIAQTLGSGGAMCEAGAYTHLLEDLLQRLLTVNGPPVEIALRSSLPTPTRLTCREAAGVHGCWAPTCLS